MSKEDEDEAYQIGFMAGKDEAQAEIDELHKVLDNIKIRSYELNIKELHDMAWAALKER